MLALILDGVYQYIVQRFIYPGEALLTAFLLAIVPYLILRGAASRLAPKADPGPGANPKGGADAPT